MYYWQRQIEERQDSLIASTIIVTLLCMIFVLGMVYILFRPSLDVELEWHEYTIQPGDTLWGIAKAVTSQPVDKTIWMIREVNGITPVIQPGQTILVPKHAEDDV